MDDQGVYGLAHEANQKQNQFLTSLSMNEALDEHLNRGGQAAWIENKKLSLTHDGARRVLMSVDDIPIAQGGAAHHNLCNALTAIGLAYGAGINPDSIRKGLTEFGQKWSDNPGRGQWTELSGVRILLDCAHNPHGIRAVVDILNSSDLCFGVA